MKFSLLNTVLATAGTLLSLPVCDASSAHRRLHQLQKQNHHSHGHHVARETEVLEKRGGNCEFPTDDPNLVAITPEKMNKGWAMSPDRACEPGHWCPIACKPGMVMAQWDPDAKITYPASMNGGLYCDNNGKIKKPFPNKPYCTQGVGSVKAVNKCAKKMSWCQTIFPGEEAMIIPTLVESIATIAVPDTSYWQKTSAHFYINPPGTDVEDCRWGKPSSDRGNYTPFVAGTNADSNGQTFVKIGFNPEWPGSSLGKSKPDFGLKIECPNGGCVGLPCQIGPESKGSGGADFCVVTVQKGKTAHIVAYDGSGGHDAPPEEPETPKPEPTTEVKKSTPPPPPPPPTTTTSTTPVEPTTTEQPTTTSTPEPTTTEAPTTTSVEETSTSSPSSTMTKKKHITLLPGIFHENGTTSTTVSSSISVPVPTQATPNPPQTTEKKAEAGRQQSNAAVAGLVVAMVAAACLF